MNQITHGGNLKAASQEFGLREDQFLDFSANINPLGIPPELEEMIKKNYWRLAHYPDPECREARAALANYHGCTADELVIGNGATELFTLAALALCPKRIVCPEPTYGGYRFVSLALDIPYYGIATSNIFSSDLRSVVSKIQKDDLVFLCHPNNPTGYLWTESELKRIIDLTMEKAAHLIIDESFFEFVHEENEAFTLIGNKTIPPHVVLIRSLTKIMAIPGLRLGYFRCSASLAARIRAKRDPWSTNALALEAAKLYPDLKDYVKRTRITVAEERSYLEWALNNIPGVKAHSGAANYIVIDCSNSLHSATELAQKSAKRGILIRDCTDISGMGGTYLRCAVRNNVENQALIRVFAEIWNT